MKGKNYNTKNKSIGKNTCEYIILHHTGTREGTATGIINAFTGQRAVSAHALIDEKGNLYTFGDYTDILWHAGQSNWGERVDLNRYSIGIELIGPHTNGGFTQTQKETLKNLIQYLQEIYDIPKQNILRHKDISPRRKWDIADSLWDKEYATWGDYRNSIQKAGGFYRNIAGPKVIENQEKIQDLLEKIAGKKIEAKDIDELLAVIQIVSRRSNNL